MGGGLIQLVCRGQQDNYLCNNPDISYFNYSYKKHTNFAIENIELTFDKNPVLDPEITDGEYTCKISKNNIDLLKNLYFCCKLPKIYSSNNLAFKWVKNIGNILIKKAVFKIDSEIIDTVTNDWLNIWNELTMDTEGYDRMIGNIEQLYNPSLSNSKKIIIRNNKFVYDYYPSSFKDNINNPSITDYKLQIPLPFWFTRNPSLALPILRLRNKEITLTITLENSEKLYTVYSNDLEENISPLFYNELYSKNLNSGIRKRDNIDLNYFTNSLNIFPYIEAVYIVLDQDERNSIINKTTLSYLVEQLQITNQTIIPSKNSIDNISSIKINNNKPTKEIIWITRREDIIDKFNNFNNFSASIRHNNNYEILNSASIIFNKTQTVIESKNSDFYNKIQPYQSHTNIPNHTGIYLYSFSFNPEKNEPSGYYNGALVETSLLLNLNNYNVNDELYNLNIKINKHNKFTELNNNYDINNYIVNIYSITYNIFEMIGSDGRMKFA
tara:strand:- start:374 stop:1864 length:1491 start_codon:yes stop_codon:yes gene_type:complete